MDVGTVTSLISSVGFPIAMCLILLKQMEKQEETQNERDTMHKQEMDSLRETLEKNTLVIQKLIFKLDKDGDVDVDT